MKRIDLSLHDEAISIKVAVEVLNMGGLIAYPTETFYAIGARFDNAEALKSLFALKGRDAEKAASLIVGSADDARNLVANVSPVAQRLMDMHWPGPLTMVLMAAEGLSEYVTTRGTVAVRVPGESFALRLARAAGYPITATSANPAGAPPASQAQTVEGYFPTGINLLIDGGPTPGGQPSTIVDATGDEIRIIRQGALRVG